MPSITDDCLRIFNSEFNKYLKLTNSMEMKKKRLVDSHSNQSIFPYPRVPYSLNQYDFDFPKDLLIPVGGLNTCYLSQFVPCDLLTGVKNLDYFPTILLAEILARAEGPLYTAIRGQGYAYGAYINCYLWAGQLSFDLYRTSDPRMALLAFYDILREMKTEEGFLKYCTEFEIDTARASIAYRWASNGSTASSVISTALRTSLQGFENIQDHSEFIKELYLVRIVDLRRVFESYFLKFFGGERVTVVTTPQGEKVKELKNSFEIKTCNAEDFISFSVHSLHDFQIE
jgi:Zn-dependent M16 (insulinase) family peptidase